MDGKKLSECVAYFKERKVYGRLFPKVREKYAGLGRLGGTVQLAGLDEEERRQLGGFFQKDFHGRKTVTISYEAMEKALQGSRFAGLLWEDILREYFGEALTARKERELAEKEKCTRFFAQVTEGIPVNPGILWLEQVLKNRGDGYLLLMKQYREAPEYLKKNLRQFLQAVPGLPFLRGGAEADGKELLAVFAAESTGNPHFFDVGAMGEQLLVAFLKESIPNSIGRTVFRAEEKAALFYEAGLMKDDLSNHVLTYGIRAVTEGEKQHEGMEGFWNRREPVYLTLMTIGGLSRAFAQRGKRVYIVENPAVFASLIREWPEAACICGNGQIRLAVLALMDLFDETVSFLYAGDFDPEGLQIAQRLKQRYGQRLKLWNYRRELYEKYLSDVEISEKSLKKLEHIELEELQEIKAALLEKKRAAYQERMLREYLLGI